MVYLSHHWNPTPPAPLHPVSHPLTLVPHTTMSLFSAFMGLILFFVYSIFSLDSILRERRSGEAKEMFDPCGQ